MKNSAIALMMTTIIATSALSLDMVFAPALHAQSSVSVVVDGNAITNSDIQHRMAFLKLQRRTGNINAMAKQQLIDEMLQRIEMKRRKLNVSQSEIDTAYEGFAKQNKMSAIQLTEMLGQAGVTADHFKNYIAVQMGWSRLVGARYRSQGAMVTEQEAVQRILKNGGVKPTTNEYSLQQVIFVIPSSRRSAIMGKRKQEANNFKAKVTGCGNLKKQALSYLDVTVRNLGHILEPQLPPEWEDAVTSTAKGKMTPARETANGLEALVICDIKKVSDDKVAQLIFSIQDNKKTGEKNAEQLSEQYLKELRDNARIQNL